MATYRKRPAPRRRNGKPLTKAIVVRAVREVEELAGDKAAEKLIIMGVAKGESHRLREIKADIKREHGEVPKGIKVGWIFKAHNVAAGYSLFDADLVGVICGSDGIPYTYYHTGNYYPISLSQVTLSKSTFMDENAEPVSVSEAVEKACGGGGYRYNPKRKFIALGTKSYEMPQRRTKVPRRVAQDARLARSAARFEAEGDRNLQREVDYWSLPTPKKRIRGPNKQTAAWSKVRARKPVKRKARKNPRKISTEIVNAWATGRSLKIDNTRTDGQSIFLHGSAIARTGPRGLEITTAGYNTSTTRERLNAIPGVKVNTKAGQLYLNGRPWSGSWTSI
jgi:hypothetical protein